LMDIYMYVYVYIQIFLLIYIGMYMHIRINYMCIYVYIYIFIDIGIYLRIGISLIPCKWVPRCIAPRVHTRSYIHMYIYICIDVLRLMYILDLTRTWYEHHVQLQHTAVHCNNPQHTATLGNTLRHTYESIMNSALFTYALHALVYILTCQSCPSLLTCQSCPCLTCQSCPYLHTRSHMYIAIDYTSLLQNILSFTGLFCKRDL